MSRNLVFALIILFFILILSTLFSIVYCVFFNLCVCFFVKAHVWHSYTQPAKKSIDWLQLAGWCCTVIRLASCYCFSKQLKNWLLAAFSADLSRTWQLCPKQLIMTKGQDTENVGRGRQQSSNHSENSP